MSYLFNNYLSMATNLETLSYENEEVFWDIKNELEKTKDQVKFENLSKDSLLKSWLEKVFYRWIDDEIRSFEKSHEGVFNNVDKYTADIIKDHPDLAFFVIWELNLPIRTEKGWAKRFVDLSLKQKLNFMALAGVVWEYTWDWFKNAATSDIMDKYQKRMNKFVEKGTQDLNTEMYEHKNIVWLTNLKKILKQRYWLTDEECKMVEKYIKTIEEHPEYVWMERENNTINAWRGRLVWMAIGVVLWAYWMYRFDRRWRISPETINTVWETVIEEPEAILQLLTEKWSFTTSGSIKKQLFTESKDPNSIIESWKNLIKRGINLFETKELMMKMHWDLGLKYDLIWSSLIVNHETWEVILRVKKPEVVIIDSRAEVTNSNAEVFEMEAFRNAEMELESNLKKQAIDKVKDNPLFYDLAREQTEKDLKELFVELQPYWVEVKNVTIEYIETIERPVE